MEIARTAEEFRALRGGLAGTIGLVPTMGALHEGHRSLMRAARAECDRVVVSIFVNPTQFGANEDFSRYPRNEDEDLQVCRAQGVDVVLLPSVDEMYPPGAETTVSVGSLAKILEGASRPGHFDGVATIVSKLFNLVQPHRAYFGEKDAQQLLVIRRLVRDLLFPVQIVGAPIVREESGLALSSRNVYLRDEERQQALSLSHGLRRAATAWLGGMRDAATLRSIVYGEIAQQPLARIDYVSLADAETLDECEGRVARNAILSVAVRFGGTRLIDNITLNV